MKFGSKVINRQCFHRRTGLETFKFGLFHGRGAVIELLEDHAWVKKGHFLHSYVLCTITRDRPRFFDQVGHQITNASIGNKHFLTK